MAPVVGAVAAMPLMLMLAQVVAVEAPTPRLLTGLAVVQSPSRFQRVVRGAVAVQAATQLLGVVPLAPSSRTLRPATHLLAQGANLPQVLLLAELVDQVQLVQP